MDTTTLIISIWKVYDHGKTYWDVDWNLVGGRHSEWSFLTRGSRFEHPVHGVQFDEHIAYRSSGLLIDGVSNVIIECEHQISLTQRLNEVLND